MKTIPIFFTFDNNYSIPAAVAFYSLLANAQTDVHYEMFVLHRDISAQNQALLKEVVARFGNATLKFLETGNFLVDNWRRGNWDGQQNGTSFTVDTLIRCFAARFFPSLATCRKGAEISPLETIYCLFCITNHKHCIWQSTRITADKKVAYQHL